MALRTIESQTATIAPAMISDIDGWKLDAIEDFDMMEIFEEYDRPREMTTQGLMNAETAEKHERTKDERASVIDLYEYRIENGLDLFTGEPLFNVSEKEDDDC